jgi:hypothetical protein
MLRMLGAAMGFGARAFVMRRMSVCRARVRFMRAVIDCDRISSRRGDYRDTEHPSQHIGATEEQDRGKRR